MLSINTLSARVFTEMERVSRLSVKKKCLLLRRAKIVTRVESLVQKPSAKPGKPKGKAKAKGKFREVTDADANADDADKEDADKPG